MTTDPPALERVSIGEALDAALDQLAEHDDAIGTRIGLAERGVAVYLERLTQLGAQVAQLAVGLADMQAALAYVQRRIGGS